MGEDMVFGCAKLFRIDENGQERELKLNPLLVGNDIPKDEYSAVRWDVQFWRKYVGEFKFEVKPEFREQLKKEFLFLDRGPKTVTLKQSKREQFRFPRSRKKRIRRKWAKNEQNFRDREELTELKVDSVDCVDIGGLMEIMLTGRTEAGGDD